MAQNHEFIQLSIIFNTITYIITVIIKIQQQVIKYVNFVFFRQIVVL
jgi:hypothetical protein